MFPSFPASFAQPSNVRFGFKVVSANSADNKTTERKPQKTEAQRAADSLTRMGTKPLVPNLRQATAVISTIVDALGKEKPEMAVQCLNAYSPILPERIVKVERKDGKKDDKVIRTGLYGDESDNLQTLIQQIVNALTKGTDADRDVIFQAAAEHQDYIYTKETSANVIRAAADTLRTLSNKLSGQPISNLDTAEEEKLQAVKSKINKDQDTTPLPDKPDAGKQ